MSQIPEGFLNGLDKRVHAVVQSIADLHRVSKETPELGVFSEAQFYRRLRSFVDKRLEEIEHECNSATDEQMASRNKSN